MLAYLKLKNFKSFKNLDFDLRGKGGKPQKTVFIYGENGAGKSNLISALSFVQKTTNTLVATPDIGQINDIIGNLGGDMNPDLFAKRLVDAFTLGYNIKKCKTIDADGNMYIEVGMYIGGKMFSYKMELSDNEIAFEELKCPLKERAVIVYSFSKDSKKISSLLFDDEKYKNEILEKVNMYWGKHTLFGIFAKELKEKNEEFITKNVNERFIEAYRAVVEYNVQYPSVDFGVGLTNKRFDIELLLPNDIIIVEQNKNRLLKYAKLLNYFFATLYGDIKEVYFKFEDGKGNGEFVARLYCKKIIGGKVREIPFKLESEGTKKLLKIFPMLIAPVSFGENTMIDELDTGIHDLLMKNIATNLIDAIENNDKAGQFIATTHNTLLLETLPQESIFILDVLPDGYKEIYSVKDFHTRTQKNNNIRLKYLSGSYGGVPNSMSLDFDSELNAQ